jgi:hypothetical protein
MQESRSTWETIMQSAVINFELPLGRCVAAAMEEKNDENKVARERCESNLRFTSFLQVPSSLTTKVTTTSTPETLMP